MSGGIAYVLDEIGDFAEKRCNTAAVDLEPVAGDAGILRNLIERHVRIHRPARGPNGSWKTGPPCCPSS